jgi:Domain of unknown function (DUF5703)/F5/8 type C domain
MMRKTLIIGFALVAGSACASAFDPLVALDAYDIVWQTPGNGERDMMPLGNGVVGLMLWTCADGRVEFYLARQDALTETDRIVKLGKVSLKLSPNPFKGRGFMQALRLRDGSVIIEAGKLANLLKLEVFVDANAPVIRVVGESEQPISVSATYTTWRTETQERNTDYNLPGLAESADVVESTGTSIIFYHRNETSCVSVLAKVQLPGFESTVPDPYIHRTFGGRMTLSGAKVVTNGVLAAGQARVFELRVVTHSRQNDTIAAWKVQLAEVEQQAESAREAATRTRAWWRSYWQRSWAFAEGDPPTPSTNLRLQREGLAPPPPSKITQACLLTRFMQTCAIRGPYPLNWQGSLFMPMTVQPGAVDPFSGGYLASISDEPPAEPSITRNPDERAWGSMGYLWQNTRLAYASMPGRGETDFMKISLFDYYGSFADLNRARANLYWGAEGQFNTEMTLCCGLMPARIYGMDRQGKPPYLTANRWGGAVDISPGLELICLMLEAYDYSGDEALLQKQILPYAHDVFRYIETRFKEREADGKIVLSPLHAVETYWDVKNPLTVVAGMQAALDTILALPEAKIPQRADYVRWRAQTPALPVAQTRAGTVLSPAEGNLPGRNNVETPETYVMFPFRSRGVGRPMLDEATRTFHHALNVSGGWRPFAPGDMPSRPSYGGWQQSSMNAALLGLSLEAAEALTHNAAYHNPGYRFPAMWGPVYDTVPDIDHGANLLNTQQLMLMQADAMAQGGKIYLLPAWPKNWEVHFKLRAPGKTTVECTFKEGKIKRLEVTPRSRARDVVLPKALTSVWPNLSQGKLVEVSSQWPGRPQMTKAAITDGDYTTSWAAEEKAREAWVTVDLQKECEVSGVMLSDAPWHRTKAFDLEGRVDGQWKKIAEGTTIGDRFDRSYVPVKARLFRLNIRHATDTPTLAEFQLFGK